MAGIGRIELSITLFFIGLVVGLGYLVLRPFIRRSGRRGAPPMQADAPVRQRPIWVVVLLTILTLGAYLYIWFGQSWAELTRVAGKLDMSRSSHLWAMAMGFDFFFRVRAHFRTINEQCALRGILTSVEPGRAIAMIASFVLIPVLVANGQRSLNRIWEHDFGPTSRPKVSAGEWVAIISLGLIFAAVVVINSG